MNLAKNTGGLHDAFTTFWSEAYDGLVAQFAEICQQDWSGLRWSEVEEDQAGRAAPLR